MRTLRVALSGCATLALAMACSSTAPPSNRPSNQPSTAPTSSAAPSPTNTATSAPGQLPATLTPTATPSQSHPTATSSPTSSVSPTPTATFDGTFPESVLGMPIISVKRATQLRDDGSVSGKELAVAGYYDAQIHSCYSGGPTPYDLALAPNQCVSAVFSDSPEHACVTARRGVTSCQGAASPTPVFMADTMSGTGWRAALGEPTALVVVGHFGDPRYLQCIPTGQVTCAGEFVADSIAWSQGQLVEPELPSTLDSAGDELSLNLSLDDLQNAIAQGQTIVSAGAAMARDARKLDPRWNRAGGDIVWIARSIDSGDAAAATRDVTVWLVNDATGAVLDSHPLTLPDGYAPAVVWFTGAHHGLDETQPDWSNVTTDLRVSSESGVGIWDGIIGGSTTGFGDTTTNGPDVPLVLDAGTFSISGTTASTDGSTIPGDYGDCSTTQTVTAGQRVRFDVDFTMGQPCTWSVSLTPAF